MTGLLVAAAALGCGSDKPYEGKERATLRGKVTFDGEPVNSGTISLEPVSEGRTAGASIVDGEYTIPEANGPNLGVYKVKIRVLESTPHPSGDEDLVETKQLAPAKYNEETTLTVAIDQAEVEKDFALEAE